MHTKHRAAKDLKMFVLALLFQSIFVVLHEPRTDHRCPNDLKICFRSPSEDPTADAVDLGTNVADSDTAWCAVSGKVAATVPCCPNFQVPVTGDSLIEEIGPPKTGSLGCLQINTEHN